MPHSDSPDRRRAPRQPVQTFARVSTEGRQEHALGTVLDVSHHGVAVRCGTEFRVGEDVLLRVVAADQVIEIRGTVRRAARAPYGLWELGVEADLEPGTPDLVEALLPCALLRPAPA